MKPTSIDQLIDVMTYGNNRLIVEKNKSTLKHKFYKEI